MDFQLTTLSDAFRSAQYPNEEDVCRVYAFVLATTADVNVFPDLLLYYRELHEITGPFIRIVSPHIDMRKELGASLDPIEITAVLRTRKFYNHYTNETVDVTHEVEEFLSQQTTESIAFARFCGIELSSLPCVVFFPKLVAPRDYTTWGIQGRSASEVVREFRSIVSALEKQYGAAIEHRLLVEKTKAAILQKEHDLRQKKTDVTTRVQKLQGKIAVWESKVAEVDGGTPFAQEARWGRMMKIVEARKEIEQLEKRLTADSQALRADIEKVQHRKDELSRDADFDELPAPTEVIEALDRKRFRRHVIRELARAVPIIGSGLSGAGIFT